MNSTSQSALRNDKIQQLYLHSAASQWAAHEKLDFSKPLDLDPEARQIWIDLATIFHTLEKMGLGVLTNMFAKAASKYESQETLLYLTMQCADEGRHVFAIEKYMTMLGKKPAYDWKYHVLGQVSSLGFFRVENWLFSTLFSESFASAFLRRAKGSHIDPLGSEMCRRILVDESRHLHFLYIVLPDIMDRMSVFGKTYLKMSQYFIMKFTETVTRTLADQAKAVGIDRRDLLEEVFGNIEKAYEGFGVSREFLYFPKISQA